MLSNDPSLAVILWLATEARGLRDPARLCSATCYQLVLAGIPIARSSWALQVHSGHRFGMGLTWQPHSVQKKFGVIPMDAARSRPPPPSPDPDLRVESFDHQELMKDRFQDSPLRQIFFGGTTIRERLGPGRRAKFPILATLTEEGFTDYLALPMRFADGRIHATTWATQAPKGFQDWQIDTLETVNHVLPLLLELWQATRPQG